MRQRVLIGIAMACEPKLLIADEPTSALDVTVQRRMLDHLQEVTAEHGTAVLFITHDLGVAADRSDRIVVMRAGPARGVGRHRRRARPRPRHEYTRRLLAAAPSLTAAPLAGGRAPPGPSGDADGRRHGGRAGGADRRGAPTSPSTSASPSSGDRKHVLRGRRRRVASRSPAARTLAWSGSRARGSPPTARLILRLERVHQRASPVRRHDITGPRPAELRRVRRRVQVVYQNPYSSLSPRLTIEQIITEPLRRLRHRHRRDAADAGGGAARPGVAAGRPPRPASRPSCPAASASAWPSPGPSPSSPTSSCSTSRCRPSTSRSRARSWRSSPSCSAELGMSYLFISHDLAVVRQIAADVAVMRAGKIVEQGPVEQLFTDPARRVHEGTARLDPGPAPPPARRRVVAS